MPLPKHEKINYVEYPSRDLQATKQFFQRAFGWTFENYGPDYAAFSDQGLDGGFFTANVSARTATGSALIVFYSADLEKTMDKVSAAGGDVIKPIYAFPGGRRFHFEDPSGYELAVWSDKTPG